MSPLRDLINWRLGGFDLPQKPDFLRRAPWPLASLKQDVERLIGTEDEANWRVTIVTDDDRKVESWLLGELRIHPQKETIIGVKKDSPTLSRHIYTYAKITRIDMTNILADKGR
ncbi:hypothetical protein ACEUZ9_002864 [Paracoccus litorisediminis]|uniref:hypothetical protein n=1 Tax=Paracoccus litorisediminis TaxID=2006130 RepID=UPI0037316B83